MIINVKIFYEKHDQFILTYQAVFRLYHSVIDGHASSIKELDRGGGCKSSLVR